MHCQGTWQDQLPQRLHPPAGTRRICTERTALPPNESGRMSETTPATPLAKCAPEQPRAQAGTRRICTERTTLASQESGRMLETPTADANGSSSLTPTRLSGHAADLHGAHDAGVGGVGADVGDDDHQVARLHQVAALEQAERAVHVLLGVRRKVQAEGHDAPAQVQPLPHVLLVCAGNRHCVRRRAFHSNNVSLSVSHPITVLDAF